MTVESLRTKYAPQREVAKQREDLVLSWLRVLGLDDVAPVGNGTGTDEKLSTWHTGIEDRFDFYSKKRNLYFEATGTHWLKSASAKRMGRATLAILKTKVDDAIDYNIDDKLIFVGVWDREENPLEKVRFMPCPNVRWYSLCNYAWGENLYYAIPWDDWLKPSLIVPRLCRAMVKEGTLSAESVHGKEGKE